MTILSHRHRFIFIAVPKTGSHSIRFALRSALGPEDEEQVSLFVSRRIDRPGFLEIQHGHQTALEVREAIGEQMWQDYLSFAVVRNPWDRFVSYVAFMMRDNGAFQADPAAAMRRVLDNPARQSRVHLRPQHDFLVDQQGHCMVNRVCRLENLQAEFGDLCRDIGMAAPVLEKRNASAHRHYADYYDAELTERVGVLYAQDIAMLGYAFGG